MESVEFLAAVRQRHGIESTRALAAFLKLERERVTAVQQGRRRLDPDMCIAVAAALELPPEYVLASVQAERAKRTEHRRLWERLAKLAKHAGAAAVVGFIASTAPAPSAQAAGHNAAENIHSAQYRDRRRRRVVPWFPDRRAA
jgi:plasmid maintenance system antidote protein VapI